MVKRKITKTAGTSSTRETIMTVTSENIEGRKQWNDIFKVLKRKKSTQNYITRKLSFPNEDEAQRFQMK